MWLELKLEPPPRGYSSQHVIMIPPISGYFVRVQNSSCRTAFNGSDLNIIVANFLNQI